MHALNGDSVKAELHNIADWWSTHTLDLQHDGFVGEIDYYGKVVDKANKGIILNSRILWFFSQLSLFSPNPTYLDNAERAFYYLIDNFDDKEYAGAVWELDYEGKLINGKKQIYAQCFCIYAYIAYYKLTADKLALEKAQEYFHLIEKNARDYTHGGYTDATSRQWAAINDFRLSDKDLNAPKTMNTHLHILEAYTALHQIAPNESTEEALSHVLKVFQQHIIDQEKGHLKLFFDHTWNDHSLSYSYGHDIEASWLLWEAVQVLGNKSLQASFRPVVIALAETCLHQGIGDLGQLCNDYNLKAKTRSDEAIWWVQTEALIGFLNAFQLSGNTEFLSASENIWRFICLHFIDKDAGEWHGVASGIAATSNEDFDNENPDNEKHYKVGFWKAPYHNGRAMMEVSRRLNKIDGGSNDG